VKEVVTRLARVGYDNTLGYLQGGFDAWKAAGKSIDTIESITADELANRLEEHPVAFLIDARRQSEFEAEHVIGAVNMPLNYLNEHMSEIDKDTVVYVYCAAGYRSMIFISAFKARGYNNLIDVTGGFKAIKENDRLPISHYVEPVSML
jgi:rhodanese-related sulfurtransferase